MTSRRSLPPILLGALVLAGCGSVDPTDRPVASTSRAEAASPAPTTTTAVTTTSATAPTAAASPPVRIRLPAIAVDAAVVPVGVEADGDMEVPGADDVGWYRFGPVPGGEGSSVLAAHVDFDGRPGAFLRLRDLRPGDAVEVDLGPGTRRFRVTGTDRYPKDALPGAELFDRSGPARLALITCGGSFDPTARSYRDNVVVFAVPDA